MDKEFPILKSNGETIPWESIASHKAQALINHGQSLEKLASRGGLSWCEALAVLRDSKFIAMSEEEAKEKVLALLPNQEWIVPVTWEACGFIKVRAESAEEACKKVHEDADDYPLPYQSEYVDASFDISGSIEEATEMSKIYTSNYNSGKWGQDLEL